MTEITLGLTTWSEHPTLIHNQRQTTTLSEYAQHFPVVELDTSFYALPATSSVHKWVQQVPAGFQFIIKAHQAMTFHAPLPAGQSLRQLYMDFQASLLPLVAAGKLKCILFQFPPSFEATVQNINYLRVLKPWLGNLPVAVEFRHASWYQPGVVKSLVDFCRDLKLTLVAADEPHDTPKSVPFELAMTNSKLAIVRLHGQNAKGWNHPGQQWRKQRTIYCYSDRELADLATRIKQLAPQPKEICIIFNNNAGGDAAANAKKLQSLLHLEFNGLFPRDSEQLDLF